jgi:hypothetical protein
MLRSFWLAFFQPKVGHEATHPIKHKWDKKITRLYDILMKLAKSKKIDDDMEFELLKVMFIESRNERPDVIAVRDWIQNYLAVFLTDYEVKELVNYTKLLRPSFVFSEIDALEETARKRPLHINPLEIGRDQWCYEASKVMLNTRKDLFIHRRRLSTAIARRQHSLQLSIFDKDDEVVSKRKPPRRVERMVGMFVKSESVKEKSSVKAIQVQPLRHSIDFIQCTPDRDATVEQVHSLDSEN